MPKKILAFTEEFTDNFSELFLESYMIRYLDEFPETYLAEAFSESLKITNQKIKSKIVQKLEDYGFSKSEINKYFK